MEALLQRIERAAATPFHELTPQQARSLYERSAEVLDLPRASLPEVRELQIPNRDGALLNARLYSSQPVGTPAQAALLYLHGGGFVVGSLETHDSLCRQLALRSGVAVLALDYRLAPEHRFPAAFDDAFDALVWLHRHAATLGLDAARLAVGGDSAGGTLAAATALLAREAGIPLCLQLLITPGTTAHADTPSHARYGEGYLLNAHTIAWFFDQFITWEERLDPRFAPLLADSLEGVAPAAVLLAECDPLVDEGLAYADRLRMAGVTVDLEITRGVVHDFIKMGRALKEAQTAQAWCAHALREALEDQENRP
jgi:acetyl esterase